MLNFIEITIKIDNVSLAKVLHYLSRILLV